MNGIRLDEHVMESRPKALTFCTTPHECKKCGRTTLCMTYLQYCPWLNQLDDQLCDECWNITSEELHAFEKEHEGVES